MRIQETEQGVILEVYVKPRSKEFKVEVDGDEVVVFCQKEPFKGKANRELVKQFSRLFHKEVELVSGFHSRLKRLSVKDVQKSEAEHVLLRK